MMVSKVDQKEAYGHLREVLSPGDTLHTVLRHVSKSGMTRWIDVYKLVDGEARYLSYWAAQLLGYSMSDKHQGVKVGGCGTDMGFHLVYSLSRRLFSDGFGEKCLHCSYRALSKVGAEHCNDVLDVGVTPHEFRGRNGDLSGWDNDGGYALRHRWI